MPLLQATTVPAPPLPPQAPSAVVGGTTIPLNNTPVSAADLAALRSRRTELSNQLTSAQGRRDDLVKELRTSPEGVARTGIEQRMSVIDERIVQIEKDIAANGRELARAPLARAETQAPPRVGGFLTSGQVTGISIVFTVTVLMPIAMAYARSIMRRASQPKPAPQVLESAARLERMEQAIDTIAVEVERISEGQRFVTQLMAPKPQQDSVLIGERHEVPR
ncbi:hypothetical protein GAU_0242 [Gemmatimonas aurantiaca T-27]|uniref:Uncharacterized protein n=1 Tax=Gemmatimonas aurantiaca (strain DSM 14586 / JCM 11422 / NBRC 100505 / T-27) TaxID=379066 RepID=C1A4X4_GEMAT|nr:hypothetical protein [Gemmatimonas aurantiaca]BAH37284.1 hypothetical protein GAU_0242 [Gemmatimonas aurantiaca T-27]